MSRFDNKVVAITGGSGGIGIAAGKLYSSEGAKVLLVDLNEDALKKAVAEIGSDNVSYTVADVTVADQVEGYTQLAVERYGGLDILLANAGIEGNVMPMTEYPVETFEKVLAVNVTGVFLGIKYAMPEMAKRGGGSIVITSSVAGVKGGPGLCAYTTSKHAVIGLMRSASNEGAPIGVRVNTVNPAPVETRMMRSLEEGMAPGAGDQAKVAMAATIPLGRYGEPSEVADMMAFLSSDAASFCTGGVYMVDGGSSSK